ncbi:Sm-like ribonucleoprotein [Mycena amicta]|nr:Sm-like ribonucleoprotein [Mycena amicta]
MHYMSRSHSKLGMDDDGTPPPAEEHSPPPQPTHTGSPTDFLKGVVGKRVIVRLTSGVDYRGVLSCLDGYMNIALEQTEEHVNGVVTNRYGDAFIRGNNVLYISAAEIL